MEESRRQGVKIFLLLLFGLVVMAAACVGAVAWWLSVNQEKIEVLGDKLKARADDIKAEAEAFARDANQSECIDEMFRRQAERGGFVSEISNSLFLLSCLEVAAPVEDLYEGVPPSDSFVAAVGYRLEACRARGEQDTERCGRMLSSLQKFCDRQNAP